MVSRARYVETVCVCCVAYTPSRTFPCTQHYEELQRAAEAAQSAYRGVYSREVGASEAHIRQIKVW